MQEQVEIFINDEMGLQVRTINNPDGSISINAEDTAIGFGWTQTQNKNGKQYTSIRWETLNGYCEEFGFPNKLGKDDYIPESLFYRLGMKANNKVADKFQNWLAMDVIPSIRKHGVYATEKTIDKIIDDPDFGIELLTKLKEEREKNKMLLQDNARMKPKEIFADAVSVSNTLILIGELAKIIKQNGIDIGQNRLFIWMRENGYLISRKGNDYNMPTQKSMNLELLEIKERAINNPDGSVRITKTVLVTGKGQQYFINKFLNSDVKEA